MKSPYKYICATVLFVGTVFFATGTSAYASSDAFCDELSTIEKTVQEKKQAHIDTWKAIKEKHEEHFGESKKNFAVLQTAYQSRKVTPAFTESAKRGEIARVQAMQTRLDQAQAFFAEQRNTMSATLLTVEKLQKEAFEKAYEACDDGVSDEVVAEAFKTDMKNIQATIRNEATDIEEEKEERGTLIQEVTTPVRIPGLFLFNSQRTRN